MVSTVTRTRTSIVQASHQSPTMQTARATAETKKASKALKDQGLTATDDGRLLATAPALGGTGQANLVAGSSKKSRGKKGNNFPGAFDGPPPPYPGMPHQVFGHSFGSDQDYQAQSPSSTSA
jgi:hypothetical protein